MFGGRAWYEELIADLASLLNAGVPLVEALETLVSPGDADAAPTPIERRVSAERTRVATALLRDVAAGSTLAEAFRSCGERIPPEHAALVAAGERSGRTTDMLRGIIADIRRRDELRLLTRGPYGIYLLTVLFLALLFLPIPLFVLYEKLPSYPIYFLVVLVALLVLRLLIVGRVLGVSLPRSMRQKLLELGLAVPWLGEQLRLRWFGRAFRLLGTLVEAGLPLSEAIPLVADATRVERFRTGFARVSALVSEEKVSLTQAFSHLDTFRTHPDWLTRLAAGERAGRLDGALLELASTVEERAQNRGRVVAALIPIALVLAIGAAVLYVGVVVVWNIYNFEV